MDLTDISKVANRKRMNNDAEKLREKVSRETAKIIKLKVAQDTAYWDLKEKLQQLEANHERLQQNMVDVQMQHETISGQYQDEMRLRPDTLNKLSGTRDICDVLEEYGERLRNSVARCRADQRALGDAYGACAARVRELTNASANAAVNAQAQSRRHEEDARRLAQALEQLGMQRARAESLDAACHELKQRLDSCSADLRRREEATAALQAEMARLTREMNSQNGEFRRTIAAHEDALNSERARGEQQKQALAVSEQQCRDERERANHAEQKLQSVRVELAEATAAVDRYETEVTSLAERNERLQNLVAGEKERMSSLEVEMSRVMDRVSSLEAEKCDLETQLIAARRQCEPHAHRIDELSDALAALQTTAQDAQTAYDAQRAVDAATIEELRSTVVDRERELDDKTGTITRLMTDLKTEAEARARADSALGAIRASAETDREAAATRQSELANTVTRLENLVKAKDDELGAQMRVILDIRTEKERLQEKISGMQGTIDNIQKELTGRILPPPPPAERDSDMLYSFLSDNSMDNDALDAREVGRRFEALARGDVPAFTARGSVSLSQMKKDMQMKNRSFFKNKRLESKLKKVKE